MTLDLTFEKKMKTKKMKKVKKKKLTSLESGNAWPIPRQRPVSRMQMLWPVNLISLVLTWSKKSILDPADGDLPLPPPNSTHYYYCLLHISMLIMLTANQLHQPIKWTHRHCIVAKSLCMRCPYLGEGEMEPIVANFVQAAG